jgi:hypothetical protein
LTGEEWVNIRRWPTNPARDNDGAGRWKSRHPVDLVSKAVSWELFLFMRCATRIDGHEVWVNIRRWFNRPARDNDGDDGRKSRHPVDLVSKAVSWEIFLFMRRITRIDGHEVGVNIRRWFTSPARDNDGDDGRKSRHPVDLVSKATPRDFVPFSETFHQ